MPSSPSSGGTTFTIGLPEWIYGLNPMVAVIEGFRWAVIGGNPPDASLLVAGVAVSFLGFAASVYYFRRVERSFADLV